ncbi:hypothetical protein IQ06DRAFT_224745 [Phaeosphaeriaceae sp. SRC1lsM3a]|nr:hypothetical protein IQ06DRAFT_224745 [Stagonospora sp. SRC1lsM3a]
MPLLLHPHLKRGLVFDESDTDPADAVEHLPRHHVNPEEQAAKRQRVERVASQYLRGRLPVIMTASLHGPFDHGWKNPWAEETRPKRKSRTSGATRHKAGISGQAGVKRVEREAKSRTGGAARRPPEFSRSPEASRAADIGLEGHEESHTLDASQHPPATAPSTREQDTSSGAHFYSAGATLPPRLQHNIVASPAPNSSSGFVYKKVGTRKWTINNAPRSKPRVIHFNSSPANKMDDRREPSSQESKKGDINGRGEVQVAASEAHKEQQSMSSAQSSRQSAMSTQAAMLLAQLEFQESTFPISSLDSPRPWSQPQEETPRPAFLERSPAITPLSVFIPQREQGHAMTSVLRGPVMSTQDLFAAASPFAMSTVKKKPAAPERERSNLRMSITSFAGQDDDADDQPSKSPILCRSRIPLAEKNTAPSPRSFGYDKGPPHSQDSPMEHTGRSFGSVELPELDLGTSLDGYGSSGSFHFAAGILGNFNDS